MSRTLNLVDHLLMTGRNFQALGRIHDALRTLKRLCRFRELPTEAAEEAQARLGEMQIQRGKFARARRHLTAALRACPENARYHYLLATAVDADPHADPQRAAEHYRRSLELDPDQPDCLVRHGELLLRLGQREEGLGCLCRAVELSPNDPEVVGKLAAGLRLANQADEARSVLRAALFRNRRDHRFHQLWNDFRFQEARRGQAAARRQDEEAGGEDGPVLLPFPRPAAPACRPSVLDEEQAAGRKVVRHDGPETLPAPHVRPRSLPGQRNVQ
jgi:tetratricopeptide (TPR) repeat protein